MEKYNELKKMLSDMGSVLVALSGGVDSTFLLRVSHDVLGENVTAVTAKSPIRPRKEFETASTLTRELGVKHILIDACELEDASVSGNVPDRCYFCKKNIFSDLLGFAKENEINFVCDGSNADDDKAYRPGAKAIKELGVRSPLKEAGLTKEEIRTLSKELGLSTWNEPSQSCYLTRFPYDTKIEKAALERVAEAEEYLKDAGFSPVRVRVYDDLARIEFAPEQIKDAVGESSAAIIGRLKKIGYNYVTIDLEGFRSGSMDVDIK